MGKLTEVIFRIDYDAENGGDNFITLTFGDVSIRMIDGAAHDMASNIKYAFEQGYRTHVENIVDPGGGSALRGKFEYGNLYSHRELIDAEITVVPTPSPAQAAE